METVFKNLRSVLRMSRASEQNLREQAAVLKESETLLQGEISA